MRELSIRNVGKLLGLDLPVPGKKCRCPFRKHKRKDKTFRVYLSRKTGDELWKCWSCDKPDNVGDAIGFYARWTELDRAGAYRDLRAKGFDVPGAEPGTGQQGQPFRRRPSRKPAPIPVEGVIRGPFLPLNMSKWRSWKKHHNGVLSRFAEERRLVERVLLDHDVVEVDRRCIGFGYRNPETGLPCRVKVRPLDRKMFWIEPRSPDGEAKALGPLYLAHDLEAALGNPEAVIITEGEPDALSLRQLGFRNVVSLPDGAKSAETVSVEPIANGFQAWLVSTDRDEEGNRAWHVLRTRARRLGIDAVRLTWASLVDDPEIGEELVRFKDANDALQADCDRADFERCIRIATEKFLGYPLEVR